MAIPIIPPLANALRPVPLNKSAILLKNALNEFVLIRLGSCEIVPPKASAIAWAIPSPPNSAVLLNAPPMASQKRPTIPPARWPIAVPISVPGMPPSTMPMAPPMPDPIEAPIFACAAESFERSSLSANKLHSFSVKG